MMAAWRYVTAFSGEPDWRWFFARASWDAARVGFVSREEGALVTGAGFSHEARRLMRRMEKNSNLKI
jgi:hypothetical protein